MTFNINNMNANNINNVEGNLYIYGGQHGVMTTHDARRAVQDLRRALPGAALYGREGAARAALAEVEAGLDGPQPDRARVAGGLERLTRLLSAAGALAGASATLVEPLRALASWLGALGTPILGLLG